MTDRCYAKNATTWRSSPFTDWWKRTPSPTPSSKASPNEDHIVPLIHRLRPDQLAAQMPDEVNARHREGSRVRIAQGKATQRQPVPAGEGR